MVWGNSKGKMSLTDLRERHFQAKVQVNALKERLREKREKLIDTDVAEYARHSECSSVCFRPGELVCCRTLQGHTGKVYSLDWSQGKDQIVSASQDGRLIVWNALTGQKTHAFKLACSWVMTCAFSPSGHAVACGGLDSICTVYALNSQPDQDQLAPKTLVGHKAYISCCKYVPDRDSHIITSSGDRTCALWELEKAQKISVFGVDSPSGHTADVTSLSISSANSFQFVSGSCDRTARLWDTRITSKTAQTYHGHEGDINTVQFFPDGLRFGTGSDDGTCRIFDTRTGHQLQLYKEPSLTNQKAAAVSIAFSFSGRLFFAAYSNADCYIWDTLTAEVVDNLKSLQSAHIGRISCLGLASDGSALCTGSWDRNLKIWALNGGREKS